MKEDKPLQTQPAKRDYLKGQFATGKTPKAADFADLFESFVSFLDDGIIKPTTNKEALTFIPREDSKILLNFVTGTGSNKRRWQFKSEDNGSLLICGPNSDTQFIKLSIETESEDEKTTYPNGKLKVQIKGDLNVTGKKS